MRRLHEESFTLLQHRNDHLPQLVPHSEVDARVLPWEKIMWEFELGKKTEPRANGIAQKLPEHDQSLLDIKKGFALSAPPAQQVMAASPPSRVAGRHQSRKVGMRRRRAKFSDR